MLLSEVIALIAILPYAREVPTERGRDNDLHDNHSNDVRRVRG